MHQQLLQVRTELLVLEPHKCLTRTPTGFYVARDWTHLQRISNCCAQVCTQLLVEERMAQPEGTGLMGRRQVRAGGCKRADAEPFGQDAGKPLAHLRFWNTQATDEDGGV